MGHKWLPYTPVIYAMCSYDVIAHGGFGHTWAGQIHLDHVTISNVYSAQ